MVRSRSDSLSTDATEEDLLFPGSWETNPQVHLEDFARLVPYNKYTRSVFSHLAQTLESDPDHETHARKFVHYARSCTPEEDSIYYGFYRLSLDIKPRSTAWEVGSGPNADLLLTSKKSDHDVAHSHCRLRHNDQGFLIAYALKMTIIDGYKELKKGDTFVLSAKQRTGIMIGNLSYLLEFTADPTTYRQRLAEDGKSTGWALPFSDSHGLVPSPTPSPVATNHGRLVLLPGVVAGATATVGFGFDNETGRQFAWKRIRQVTSGEKTIAKNEITLLRSISHDHICRLADTICGTSTGNNEVTLILYPAARMKFKTSSTRNNVFKLFENQPSTVVEEITRQCCSAIAYLHSERIMHRDIKPDNLGLEESPLMIVLFDFGVATRENESLNHKVGTIRYLAPEVMALKHERSAEPYTRKADVWSLGITLFEVFLQENIGWQYVSQSELSKRRKKLETAKSSEGSLEERRAAEKVISVVMDMLRWTADDRIDARGAERVLTSRSDAAGSRKKERTRA